MRSVFITCYAESILIVLPTPVKQILLVSMLTPRLNNGPTIVVAVGRDQVVWSIDCQVVHSGIEGLLQLASNVSTIPVDSWRTWKVYFKILFVY